MPKKLIKNTLGELFELGKSTGKKTTKAIKQSFNPFYKPESTQERGKSHGSNANELRPSEVPTDKSTPLNLDRLQERYRKQDEEHMNSLKQKLFNLVKEGEKEAISEKRKKDEEKKRKEEEEKRRKEQEEERKRQQESRIVEPKGKERKSIFARKKKKSSLPEMKPTKSKH